MSSCPQSNSRPRARHLTASRRVLAVVGVCACACVTVGCESTTADREAVLALVNRSRDEAGEAPVEPDAELDAKADEWAQTLRTACDLQHSDLDDGVGLGWWKLGENVGNGRSIEQVHDAFMRSPSHRATILDPSFESAGTAAVRGPCQGHDKVFVVQVFKLVK